MIPTHQPLTVKDLAQIGVIVTLVGFLGFTICLWLLIWLGMDEKGQMRRPFKWLAIGLVFFCAVMLWGLAKA